MAIQQHPIPQDISNYRFRLIGDMTIRQFASLGIFIILSIIIYGSPIPFFFRYPLAFIFLVTGIAMAFIPIQGRSLDVWIVAFIKSIYSPTQYVWKSTPTEDNTSPSTNQEPTTNNSPITPIVPLSTPMSSSNDTNTTPTNASPLQVNQPVPPADKPEGHADSTEQPTNRETETPTHRPTEIPATPPITIEKSDSMPPADKPEGHADSTEMSTSPKGALTQLINRQTEAPPSISLPIPFTPTTPNTIVGLSLTPDNHILDGVMIEIKKDNLTVRATRSNKLGQFLFARPLENGLYQILAEKEGFTFTPYALELNGEIIRPLKIQAI